MQALHQYAEVGSASMDDPNQSPNQSLKRAATPFGCEEAKSPKRTRGRTGCLNCRRRRKKCDESKPGCSKCQSRGEECEWDTGITFRVSGLDPEHPSMLQAKTPKSVVSHNGLRIVDVQFNTKKSSSSSDKAASKQLPTPVLAQAKTIDSAFDININGSIDERSTSYRPTNHLSCGDVGEGTLCTIPEEPPSTCEVPEVVCNDASLPKCRRFPLEQANPADVVPEVDSSPAIIETVFGADEEMPDYPRSNSEGSSSLPSLPWSTALSASSVTSLSSRSTRNEHVTRDSCNDELTHLDSLDCLMNIRSIRPLDGVPLAHVDSVTGLDKSRQKFHQQVHDLVQKISLAHQTSSDTDADESATALRDLRLSTETRFNGIRLVHSPLVARPLGCTKLEKRRQLELWSNYIDNIAPSLDVCGTKRYFQHSLPMLAKTADHLHYAVLALSSRHMCSRERSSHAESQGLHQDAINLLLPELHNLDTPTIATVVLLCILDLLSASPSQCSISLHACAAILETADINVRSGGLRQALFWCFATFAVWHSLSHPEQPIALSTRLFHPSDSLFTAVNYVRLLTAGEGYARYAVFLVATVMDILLRRRGNDGTDGNYNSDEEERQKVREKEKGLQAQRLVLTELLADWNNCRPEDMQPLMSYPSILGDQRHPFPMVLYPSASAAVGNLLYHCGCLWLLQNMPEKGPSDRARDNNGSVTGIRSEKGKCNADFIFNCTATSSLNVGVGVQSPRPSTKPQTTTRQTINPQVTKTNPSKPPCSSPEVLTNKGQTWHARQICGILSEASDPAVLVHGRYALNVAGKVMAGSSGEREGVREAVLGLVGRCGW